MKNLILIFCLFGLFSCDIKEKVLGDGIEENIKGRWQVVYTVNYQNGKETVISNREIDPQNNKRLIPSFVDFNEYGEAVFSELNEPEHKNRVFKYSINGDSIFLENAGSLYIKELDSTFLTTVMEMKIDYFKKEDAWGKGKWMITTSYEKVPKGYDYLDFHSTSKTEDNGFYDTTGAE